VKFIVAALMKREEKENRGEKKGACPLPGRGEATPSRRAGGIILVKVISKKKGRKKKRTG